MEEQFSQQIQKGIQQYQQQKQVDDIDLINDVRQILIESGLQQNVLSSFDNNRFILEAINKPSSIQRFLLNRYWNQQLMYSPKLSIEERYCLIPDGEVQDWLRLFKAKVMPFIIANGLPVSI